MLSLYRLFYTAGHHNTLLRIFHICHRKEPSGSNNLVVCSRTTVNVYYCRHDLSTNSINKYTNDILTKHRSFYFVRVYSGIVRIFGMD